VSSAANDRPSSANPAGPFSRRQQLFIRYTSSVLVDLTVLNLFNEFSDYVVITSFAASLLAAALLQALLRASIAGERKIAAHLAEKPGAQARTKRLLSTVAILFGSKFVMLGAINISFGHRILFLGPMHGALAFIVVVLTMLLAEGTIRRIYLSLS